MRESHRKQMKLRRDSYGRATVSNVELGPGHMETLAVNLVAVEMQGRTAWLTSTEARRLAYNLRKAADRAQTREDQAMLRRQRERKLS